MQAEKRTVPSTAKLAGQRVMPRTRQSAAPPLFAFESLEARVCLSSGLIVPSVGPEGQGLVFVDREGASWTVADVAAESGGPSATGDLVAWFDERTDLARAAAATDRGLTIYSELANGAWSYEVPAESLGTGTVMRSELATTIGPGGSRNIIGLTEDGDLVRYVLPSGPSATWREWNITENHLEWRGLATPDFIGSIVAVGTSWGGLNIAGIDTNGDLVTVWTTLTAGRWYVSNLSDNAGVGPLWTGLDGASAGRNGIHFSAIDSAGKLTLISWKPGDSSWTATTVITSPSMQYDEISLVYDAARAALYVATRRLDSGALILHTVSLSLPPPTIPWVTISGFGAPAERRVARGVRVGIGADGLISAFGINPHDETVRFSSTWSFGTAWDFENLTEIAT